MTLQTHAIATENKALLKQKSERFLPEKYENLIADEIHIFCSHRTGDGSRKTVLVTMPFGKTKEEYEESVQRQLGHIYPDLQVDNIMKGYLDKNYAELLKRENVN